jgi:hypothetical protein
MAHTYYQVEVKTSKVIKNQLWCSVWKRAAIVDGFPNLARALQDILQMTPNATIRIQKTDRAEFLF